ncbi:MAG: hypothetical protein ABIH21_05655 [Patescibacteria group bacterium]
MRNFTCHFLIVLFGLTFIFGFSSISNASALYFNQPKDTYRFGESFTIPVYLNTQGGNINAAEVIVAYPKELLSVQSVNTGGSFIQFWVNQPQVDAINGFVSFVGGLPNPGFYGVAGKIGSITFVPHKTGEGQLSIGSGSRVLLNDGKGTEAPLSLASIEIKVDGFVDEQAEQETSQDINVVEEDQKLDTPKTYMYFNLSCDTHPDSENWYSQKDVQCMFASEPGAVFYFDVNQSQKIDYNKAQASFKKQLNFSVDEEGVWYLHAYAKNNDRTSRIIHRQVQIDFSKPEISYITHGNTDAMFENKVFLVFSATDSLSGVKDIFVQEKDGEYVLATSPYVLENQKRGKYQVNVKAVDYAGNEAVQTYVMRIPGPLTNTDIRLIVVGLALLMSALVVLGYIIHWLRLNWEKIHLRK